MSFAIEDRQINKESDVFVIAELSANHQQDIEIAIKTIHAAKKSGADAIKLQTYTADTLTIDCDNKYFRIEHGTLWDGRTLYDLYKEAYTPWEWQPILKEEAERIGLVFFSTPFDKSAVDFLERLDVPAYKVASFEITDIPLIEYIASKGKPVIISTGVATYDEIDDAVKTCKAQGNNQIAMLKCTSAYPSSPDEINLLTIPDMAKEFDVISGLSDHTSGIAVSIASIPLGAKIIERHLILDRYMGGSDAAFSLEPGEFEEMVNSIRVVEKALGQVSYEPSPKSRENRIFTRSLFAVKHIKKGENLSEENIRSIRPGYGMPPKHFKKILGKKAATDLVYGTPLSMDLVE
jgi:pseudaminic acid synthase